MGAIAAGAPIRTVVKHALIVVLVGVAELVLLSDLVSEQQLELVVNIIHGFPQNFDQLLFVHIEFLLGVVILVLVQLLQGSVQLVETLVLVGTALSQWVLALKDLFNQVN